MVKYRVRREDVKAKNGNFSITGGNRDVGLIGAQG
jgi:hypothetical protein